MADETTNGGETPAANNTNGETPAEESVTFDGWLDSQPDEVKTLIEGHISGLKSALQSEREQRKTLSASLKDASKKAEKDSELRQQLEELSEQQETYEQKMAFYEAATAAGIGNLKLAWLAATESGAVGKDGTVALETLKTNYPELFESKRTPPPGNAGAGAGAQRARPAGMNAFIRSAAGRETT